MATRTGVQSILQSGLPEKRVNGNLSDRYCRLTVVGNQDSEYRSIHWYSGTALFLESERISLDQVCYREEFSRGSLSHQD